LHEHFGKTKAQLRAYGKLHPDQANEAEDAFIRSSASPDSIIVVVSGAGNAGVSTVCPFLGGSFRGLGVGAPGTREIVFKQGLAG
jgi:hypothetical protein